MRPTFPSDVERSRSIARAPRLLTSIVSRTEKEDTIHVGSPGTELEFAL